MAIRSFRDALTSAVASGATPKGFPTDLARGAIRKLTMIEYAKELADLRSPPRNHLDALKGNRSGRHTIRINDQWRIGFVWTDACAEEVEIVDYH
ncbi:type II toxin-antitoxin system RelE/ParE family toxin [Rhizobium sp. 2YAF20]|uniref:type II toxin-antitoxin system RelE/ParE family toxin n=1 Tax=Rhizobium sp. 2YAF20 TaxID=3233027 RepID=UPI003F9531E8